MTSVDKKSDYALGNASMTDGKDLDQLLRLYHKALWKSIDQLAKDNKLTITGFAKKAGMDFKLITPSRRETEDHLHWPSLSTLNRLYGAVDKPLPFIDNEGKEVVFKPQITAQDQCDAIEALVERHTISFPNLGLQCGLNDNTFQPCRKKKGHAYAYETSVFVRPFILFNETVPFLTKKLSELTHDDIEMAQETEKPKKIKTVTKTVKPKAIKATAPQPVKPLPQKQEPEEKTAKTASENVIPVHKKAGADWIKEKTMSLTEYYAGEHLVKLREMTYTVAHEAWRISPSAGGDKEVPGKEALNTLLECNITDLRLQKLYQFCKFDITNIIACTKAIQYGLKKPDEIMTAAFGNQVRFSPEMLVDDVRRKDPNFARAPS